MATVNVYSQSGITEFSHSYFRSDPFITSFSNFIRHLTQDPDIGSKRTNRRTDTSFFSFSGIYQSFNPFFFKPKKLEVYLDETPIPYTDSLFFRDTIIVYQLIAYATGDGKGIQEVRKEFDKIHRRYNKKFYKSSYHEFKSGDTLTGAAHHYFTPFHGLAPITLYWTLMDESRETVLTLVMRLKLSENRVTLPAAFYNPE